MRREVMMTSHRGMRKNLKGAALFMVVSMMSLVILMVMFAYMLAVGAQRKAITNYYSSQSYVSSKNVLDVYTTYLTAPETSVFIDTAQGGIGVTSQTALRDAFVADVPDDGAYHLVEDDVLSGFAGTGTVKIEGKKDGAGYIIRVTTTTGTDSAGDSTAVVTKKVNLIQDAGMGLFDNSLISMGTTSLAGANSVVYGGTVQMNGVTGATITDKLANALATPETEFQAGLAVIGDTYIAGNTKFNRDTFLLGQKVIDVASGGTQYEVDTMEILGNANFASNLDNCAIINNTDSALINTANLNSGLLPKGDRPYILVGGNMTINSTTGNGFWIGCKYDPSRIDQQGTELIKNFNPRGAGEMGGGPVDVYVRGNLICNGANDIKINGNLYVGGTISGSNVSRLDVLGTRAAGSSVPATIEFSEYDQGNYPSVSTFMTTALPTGSTPQALMNAAVGSTVVNIPTTGGTVTDSCALTGGLSNGTLIIDISTKSKAAGDDDVWIKVPSSFMFQNESKVLINNGSVPSADRVNIYMYTDDGGTVDLGKTQFGLDIRDGGSSTMEDATTTMTPTLNDFTKPATVHHVGTNVDPAQGEVPMNLFWLMDGGTFRIQNDGALFKGYFYGPDANISISNAAKVERVNYDGIEYNVNTKKTAFVGSMIGNIIGGAMNDADPLYVKPNTSLLDQVDPSSDVRWVDSGLYNNH